MGKVIALLYCDLCKKPVSRREVRKIDFSDVPVCDACYRKYFLR